MYKKLMFIALTSYLLSHASQSTPGNVWAPEILVKKNNRVEILSCSASDFCLLVQRINLVLCDEAQQALKKNYAFQADITKNMLHVHCIKKGWFSDYSQDFILPLFKELPIFSNILLIYDEDNKSFCIDYNKKRVLLLLKAINASQ